MFDAIVLTGGRASRLGGADKPGLPVGGMPLLDRVLTALAGAGRIAVVGPARAHPEVALPPLVWCREEPAGGGPVAALAAGLARVEAPTVLVLAADLPFIAPAVPMLHAALAGSGSDCAALVDASGRVNYLAAAWRRESLARALVSVGEPRGAAMRELSCPAGLLEVPDPDGWGQDCDTWADVGEARRRLLRERSAP